MRPNASSVGSPGLPTRFSLAGTLLLSVAMTLAVAVTAVALLHPTAAVAFAAGSATAYAGPAAARRLSAAVQTDCEGEGVRLPLTDRCLDV